MVYQKKKSNARKLNQQKDVCKFDLKFLSSTNKNIIIMTLSSDFNNNY